METQIALFIAGIAAGVGLHRLFMAFVLYNCPDTRCAYCEWLCRKKLKKVDVSKLDTISVNHRKE